MEWNHSSFWPLVCWLCFSHDESNLGSAISNSNSTDTQQLTAEVSCDVYMRFAGALRLCRSPPLIPDHRKRAGAAPSAAAASLSHFGLQPLINPTRRVCSRCSSQPILITALIRSCGFCLRQRPPLHGHQAHDDDSADIRGII